MCLRYSWCSLVGGLGFVVKRAVFGLGGLNAAVAFIWVRFGGVLSVDWLWVWVWVWFDCVACS